MLKKKKRKEIKIKLKNLMINKTRKMVVICSNNNSSSNSSNLIRNICSKAWRDCWRQSRIQIFISSIRWYIIPWARWWIGNWWVSLILKRLWRLSSWFWIRELQVFYRIRSLLISLWESWIHKIIRWICRKSP